MSEATKMVDRTTEVVRLHPEPADTGLSARVLQAIPAEPERALALHESWAVFAAVACALYAALAAVVWVSAHVHPDAALHRVALFVHLASLVLGFGAVLVADYLLLRWLFRRSSFAEAVRGAARLHVPVWCGLAGLAVSGMLLEPNLDAWTARLKLGLIAVLTLNGLQAAVLSKRSERNPLSLWLLAWGGATTTVSQACWWGSVLIGFLTATKP